MKHKFIAIITIIFLATAQQAVAQKPVQITDSLGNVWEGKQNTNNEWDGSVKVTLKTGGVLTLSFYKGVRNPDAKFDNNEFNITGKLNDQFRFHDPKAKYILKKNPNITYSVEFNNGDLIKINSMEQTKMGIKLIADFDENFNIIDGKAEYKYTNASYAYIEVSGTIKNGVPEGEFTAYKAGKIVGNGTYSNGKLINGTEVLGTNDKNVMFRTRKITDQRIATLNKSVNNNSQNQSDNNSQNQGFDLGLNTNKNNSDYDKDVEAAYNGVYAGLKQNGVKIIGTDLVKNGVAVVSGQMLYGNHNYAVVVISKSGATLKTVRENKLSSPTFSNIQNNNLGNGVTARYYQFKTFDNNIANKTLYAEVTQTSGTVAIIVYDNQK